MTRALNRLALVSALLIAAAGFSGCGAGGGGDSGLAAAREALGKRDYKAAIVSLKQVLQAKPDSQEARLLLGKTLVEAGDVSGGEVELKKARDLGAPQSAWALPLSKAMLQQSKFQLLVDEFGSLQLQDAAEQAGLRLNVAAARFMLGQANEATKLIETNLAADSTHVDSLLLKARILARPGSLPEAIDIVDGVVARNPKHVEALRLQGDLQLYGRKDLDKADAAYQRVLKESPGDLNALSSRILIALARKNGEEARKLAQAMASAAPQHPQTKLMSARVEFLYGDIDKARELATQLLKLAPDNPVLLEFAGAVELRKNAPVQAEGYLGKAVSKNPELMSARRLLADAFLRQGQPARALEVLQPSLAREAGVDSATLSLAGDAALRVGDARSAERYFLTAAKVAPDDAKVKTALALLKLSKGQADSAFSELRAIGEQVTDSVPDMALISAAVRRGKFDEALRAAATLDKKLPDKATAPFLKARVEVLMRNLDGARADYLVALKREPRYLPAIQGLAALDVATGKVGDAVARYQDLLKDEPKNAIALMDLAGLQERSGMAPAEVAKILDQAVQAGPSSVSIRLAQIHHFIGRRDIKSALNAAQAAVTAIPGNAEILDALGSVQLLSGDGNQAVATFNKLAVALPKSAKAQMRLADAYLNVKNPAQAEKAFRKALELSPGDINAQRGLIALAVQARQKDRSLQVAADIQKQYPDDAFGNLLEGDIQIEFNDPKAAVAAYKKGLDRPRVGRVPERLYVATEKAYGKTEAERFGSEWLKKRPSDGPFLLFLGSRALAAEDFGKADQYFGTLVKVEPENALALNNLAWIHAKLAKPDAMTLAESAVKLQPENPALLDTLAFVQSAAGKHAQALDTCKAVLLRAPKEPSYRLNCAKVQAAAGKKAEALAELKSLAELGNRFSGHAEVQATIERLK